MGGFRDTYVAVGGGIAAIMYLMWRLLRMQRSMYVDTCIQKVAMTIKDNTTDTVLLLNSGLCGDTRSGSSVIVITSISSIIDICTLYTLTAAFISRAEKKVARWKVSS